MDHWRLAYLGMRQIPQELSEFELATFFTYSPKERALIDARRSPLYRLAVAVHIGFIRMTGRTLDACKQVPRFLWAHVGAQVGVTPPDMGTLNALYDGRTDTLSNHQMLAYQALGFSPMAEHQRRYVTRWLKERLTGQPSRTALFHELKRWLYEHRILIPHDRALKRLISQAVATAEAALAVALVRAYGASLDTWGISLARPHGDRTNLQQWLWAVPLRTSTHQIGELFDKVELLYKMGIHRNWPAACNEALIRYYARRCANRPPSVSKRVAQQPRRLEAACFLRYALCVATDHLATMLRHWIQKSVNDVRRLIEAGRPDPGTQMREFATAVKALAADEMLTRDALCQQLSALADAALNRRAPSRASLIRAQLLSRHRQARALLGRLVLLPFSALSAHPVIEALAVLQDLYAQRSDHLPDPITIRLGRAWQPALDGEDRQRALAAFEWGTLFALRVGLRNGSVFLEHSFAFRSQATLLISASDWKAKRNHFYGHLKLPQDAQAFLKPVVTHLDESLARLRDAVVCGKLKIDDAIHIDPLVASATPANVETLRGALFEPHPGGQLPEILLEIDSATHFSWLLLGREPHSRSELLLVYAAILAHGTSMSAADLARMVPELSPPAIRQMMHRVADERKLRHAAEAVLTFMHQHPIAQYWGRSDLASSDMMSLETTRSVWKARADPRRRTASIGMYTHVRDRWGIFYDQPILLNERQAGAAIEGVIRQSGSEDVAQLAVDTHGFTDFAMSLSRLLGFDLCPRLSHLRDRRLHVPRHHNVPGELAAVTDADVRLSLIESAWDELVRIAASAQSGQCTAVQALSRFGVAARGQPVYEAGMHLGRLFRTIFLIDYFTNTAFRHEMQHVLNRGEAVHILQRAIHSGKIPIELARHDASLAAVSSSLTLLSNSVMAWNTMHMQRSWDVLERINSETTRSEDLRHIGPTHLEGINLRGTFEFPIARYAHRLMPTAAFQSDSSSQWRTA